MRIDIDHISSYLSSSIDEILLFVQLLGIDVESGASTLGAADIAHVVREYVQIYNPELSNSLSNHDSELQLYCSIQNIVPPDGLVDLYDSPKIESIIHNLYRPAAPVEAVNSLYNALRILEDGFSIAPSSLFPLIPVDEMSIACVVCRFINGEAPDNYGKVVRWHLGEISSQYQAAILDCDVETYLLSVAAEKDERQEKLKSIRKIAQNYQKTFTGNEKPKGYHYRPVQIACQNVIVGMAAFRHDSMFEGLRVSNYLTCEVPHLGTHEANRAVVAMILCDAFQNGGTMEIRFGRGKNNEVVPHVLRRFGRSLGIELGAEDPIAITPKEARRLFWAVTKMSEKLRKRVDVVVERGLITPERICFTLLASIWREIELDYLLATSSRAHSILEGGAHFDNHADRLAEQESSRAALMLGILFRRLDAVDTTKVENGSRSFSDNRHGVHWKIDSNLGVVTLMAVPSGQLTWSASEREQVEIKEGCTLLVVPRGLPTLDDCSLVRQLINSSENTIAVMLVPSDVAEAIPIDLPLLVCPERLSGLDSEIEEKLRRLRLGRS